MRKLVGLQNLDGTLLLVQSEHVVAVTGARCEVDDACPMSTVQLISGTAHTVIGDPRSVATLLEYPDSNKDPGLVLDEVADALAEVALLSARGKHQSAYDRASGVECVLAKISISGDDHTSMFRAIELSRRASELTRVTLKHMNDAERRIQHGMD